MIDRSGMRAPDSAFCALSALQQSHWVTSLEPLFKAESFGRIATLFANS